jgi:glutathione S-transferase
MRLFAMPGTCALAPNIVAIWGGVDLVVVNLERGQHREPDYLSINPKGQVPALVLDDGHIITEASAIMRYLAALATQGDLNPTDPLGWAAIDEALSYFTSEIHADFGGHFATQRFAQSEAAQNEVRFATYEKLREHLGRLEASFQKSGGSWYLGKRTIADAYLFVILRWVDGTPIELSDYPRLSAYRSRLAGEPWVLAAMQRQGMG